MIGAVKPRARSRLYTRRYHRTVPPRPALNRLQTVPGSIITIQISNGIPPAPPPPPVGLPPGIPGFPPEVGSTVVEIPGLPPITVPVLGPPPPAPPPPP